MTINDYWDTSFTLSEKLLFQKCCRTFLKRTFIVRDKDDENKKMYYFISKNADFFSGYLGYMGFDAVVLRDSGIVMLQNIGGENDSAKIAVNKMQLKKVESIVLCCLWTLLADRIHSRSLDKQIKITLADLNFELDKFDFKGTLEKGRLENILQVFSRFNLIGLKGTIGENDFYILLYPSLQFALNESDFTNFAKTAQERMRNPSNNSQADKNTDSDTKTDSFDNIEFETEEI